MHWWWWGRATSAQCQRSNLSTKTSHSYNTPLLFYIFSATYCSTAISFCHVVSSYSSLGCPIRVCKILKISPPILHTLVIIYCNLYCIVTVRPLRTSPSLRDILFKTPRHCVGREPPWIIRCSDEYILQFLRLNIATFDQTKLSGWGAGVRRGRIPDNMFQPLNTKILVVKYHEI